MIEAIFIDAHCGCTDIDIHENSANGWSDTPTCQCEELSIGLVTERTERIHGIAEDLREDLLSRRW
jgi:hypothetical protein